MAVLNGHDQQQIFCNSSAVSTGKYQWLKVVEEQVTIWKAQHFHHGCII